MKDEDKVKKQKYPTAFQLFILVIFFSFTFEAVIMFLLFSFESDLSIQAVTFYDASLLTVMLFPALYFFLYRPVVLHITERKWAEEKLRENEERFRLVAHSATDAIISVDNCGRITFWNNAAETIFSYTADEIIDKPITTIIPERFREKHKNGINRVISTGKSKIIGKTIEVAGLRKDGSEFPVELSLSKWETREGIFFTGILRDITERKRVEAEVKIANERMRADLEAAAKIQKSLLPREYLEIQGVRFACAFKPCDELGGDIFNVFRLDEKHIGLYILDVSGHGVTAALLSVTLNSVIYSLPRQSSLLKQQIVGSPEYRIVPPAEVAQQLNRQFLMNSEKPQYFTLVYGILNLETYEFRYVSAGHPSLIYLSHDSDAVILGKSGFPIGCFKEANYEESSVYLKPRDRLYLYSDGVTDAMNSNEEQFDKRRLINVLDQSRDILLKDSILSMLSSVDEWRGDAKLMDDVSILAVEIGEKINNHIS
jgi:PAS domain S-box-containing protein